jgi:hypothetical protein
MRNIILIISVLLLFSCDNKVAGTLGSGYKYLFKCNEKDLNLCLDNYIRTNDEFKVPEKWEKYNNWTEKGYDFLDGKIFYFKKDFESNEEMYFVSVLNSYPKNNNQTNVAVRAVFKFINNSPRWLYFDDINRQESEKIELKFQKFVLDNMSDTLCNCKNYEIIK